MSATRLLLWVSSVIAMSACGGVEADKSQAAADAQVDMANTATPDQSCQLVGNLGHNEANVPSCLEAAPVKTTDSFEGPTPNPENKVTAQSSAFGPYKLIARHSDLCLDIDKASTSNGAKVLQWWCGWGDNQRFVFHDNYDGTYTIQVKHSGKCLDAYGYDIVQQNCNGADHQKFWLENVGDDYVAIHPKHTYGCFDVYWNLTTPGTGVIRWDCHGGWNQHFKLSY
ncbi:MAG TPA: RICIN domain-containing protein [Myxococcaceae bacterium]|jgi:hypothetical protein